MTVGVVFVGERQGSAVRLTFTLPVQLAAPPGSP